MLEANRGSLPNFLLCLLTQICPDQGWLFMSIPSRGLVAVYRTIQRKKSKDPELFMQFNISGGVPSNLLLNSNCTLLAVSNEGQEEAVYGTITLLRDLLNMEKGKEPTQTNIPMDRSADDGSGWDDDYVLRKGLHMPLTKNALEYWDEHSHLADEANFTDIRTNYRSSLFLEGEYLAWSSPKEDELLVNLQVNNGMLRINVTTNSATALVGYGLKDHGITPVDINSHDKLCNLTTYQNLFALRMPDSIRTLRYNGKLYLLTANEGSKTDFGPFSDRVDATELFLVSLRDVMAYHVLYVLVDLQLNRAAKILSYRTLLVLACQECGWGTCKAFVKATDYA
jgi:hypothetical protein